MIFKTIKPDVYQTFSRANPNQPGVNFFSPYANPTNSVIPKSLAKPSRGTSYIFVLITCPLFQVQSVDVNFSGRWSSHLPRKSWHGLHHFAPLWARAGPRAAQSTPRECKTLIVLMWTKQRRRLGGKQRLVGEPVYRVWIDGLDDWPAHNRMPHKRGFANE